MIKKKRYNSPMAKFHKLKPARIICGSPFEDTPQLLNLDDEDGEEQW